MSINWDVKTFASLPSTQDYAKELGEEGLPEGLVIQCLEQNKGRGRHGNKWFSPMGNLYMSFLLRPNCSAEQAGQISFITALAVSAAMDKVIGEGHSKTLKWPNDILIDGKKCAGILLESDIGKDGKLQWLAVGIGVNILNPPDDTICLKDVVWDSFLAIHPFRDMVLAEFDKIYMLWQDQGFEAIRKDWLAQAHGIGKKLTVRLPGSETEGIFKDIDENGQLKLELPDGNIIDISSGEVYFGT